jgi:PAS domain S-box-containing protein
MSQRIERKKQNAERVKQIVSTLEKQNRLKSTSSDAKFKEIVEKYNTLIERYKQLEKVYEFHRGIIQNISSGILTTDMQGKVTFINRAALEALGYVHRDIQEKEISVLFANPQEGKQIMEDALKKGVEYESRETHLLTKDKKVITVGFSITPLRIPESKENYGLIFIFRNIDYIASLRRQIERMDRLATLGELSAGIAHEIRNPLAGIKTSAQVLEESFSPGDFRSQLISRIVKEIDRSNELLKRFFHFAKPSKPKQDFYNIEMIVDGVYLLMANRLKKNNIKFTTKFADNTPQVYIDESQIEQVILNLFLNALEAMKNGGELTVETGVEERVNLSQFQQSGRAVFVRVTDTGIGIPKDKVEKVFNPFYTSKSDGVGLGLSISSRLLEENGGKIELHSEEGKGCSFVVFLPVVETNV